MLRSLGLALAVALAGCGGAEDPEEEGLTEPGVAGSSGGDSGQAPAPDPVCEAGRTVECPCVDAESGAQSCADDGSKWLECVCAEPGTEPPEVPPSEACEGKLMHDLIPDQECPDGKPVAYFSCPKEYVTSEVCAPNRDGQFTCCPE
jgi:hypothetical protein